MYLHESTFLSLLRTSYTPSIVCILFRAAQILKNTGKSTTLTVGKQAAQFYGLMNLINSPSPRNMRRSTPSEGEFLSGQAEYAGS